MNTNTGFKKGDEVELTLDGDRMYTGEVTRVAKGYATILCKGETRHDDKYFHANNPNGRIPETGMRARKI